MTQASSNSLYGSNNSVVNHAAAKQAANPPVGTSRELAALLALDSTIRAASPIVLAGLPTLEAAIRRADAIEAIRGALTDDVMRRFYPLMNTALGFRCDRPSAKNREAYSVESVRGVFVEALLIGLPLTDNRFNIIADRLYVTREGFTFLLANQPGLTDLRIEYGVPVTKNGGAVVPCEASWLLNGVHDNIVASIPVRTDQYSSIDQTLGKADRKIKARIYNRINGSVFTPDGEVEDEPTRQQPEPSSDLADIKREVAATGVKPAEPAKTEAEKTPERAESRPPQDQGKPEPRAGSWTRPPTTKAQTDISGAAVASISKQDIDAAFASGDSGSHPPADW